MAKEWMKKAKLKSDNVNKTLLLKMCLKKTIFKYKSI